MRRTRLLLPALVGAVVLLAPACGSDEPTTAADPAPAEAGTAGSTLPTPDEPAPGTGTGTEDALSEPSVVELVSLTAAGGEVTTQPTPIDTTEQQAAYLADFDDRMTGRLRSAIRGLRPPPGASLTATVVAVGCESPTSVEVTRTDDGWEVRAPTPTKPGVQCLAAVTTVALVLLPT